MLKSLTANLQELNKPSSILLMSGIRICCALLIAATYIYFKNDMSANYSFATNDLAKSMVSITTFVFAEVIIGSLFMDIYAKKNNIEL